MAGLASVMALAVPLMVSDEQSLFHIPGAEDFRVQAIGRSGSEREWPFTVDRGYLFCAYVMGERTVYFAERPTDERQGLPRTIVVSADPFDLMLSALLARDLIAPFADIEELIVRMGPFQRAGRQLCDQPRGITIGPGEL